MLWKLLREMPPDNRPTHLAIVFDKSEKTFRKEIYPAYKAHRPPAPDDLIPQFALIREAVRAFGLPCLEQDGFEADDLIATYAREACERGATVTIVSSDKDLMQLVPTGVTMYDTYEGPAHRHRAEVIEKFGVPPEQGRRGAGAGRRQRRQCAGRARHRRQDRGAADQRIWRPRHAAGARRRDQAAEAPRGADRERREGADLAATRAARRRRAARRAARRTRGARAGRAKADRLSEGDGIHHADATRRRVFADRSGRCNSGCCDQEWRLFAPPPRGRGSG